jgi:phosphatidylinositol glycan class B
MSLNKLYILAILVYGITAIFSNSYYHPDEHYQIVEFAELKSGNNLSFDLAWEYRAQIRCALQPTLLFLLFNGLRTFGITDVFKLMMIVRLLTALLSVYVLRNFISNTKRFFQNKYHLLYTITCYFLWFLPFIYVRFSSESYSGILFLLSVALVNSENKKKYILAGLALGLSFLFRFQAAFMIIGLLSWLILVNRTGYRQILQIFVSIFCMSIIGILIDYWFYDSFTITFLNYFEVNILQNVASKFGTSPWYYYFISLPQIISLPFALVLYSSIIITFIFNKNNIALWILIPFLLIHVLIPHKEMRFLFPLAGLMPMLIVSSTQSILTSFKPVNKKLNLYKIIALTIFSVANLVGLIIVMFAPADNGRVNVMQSIQYKFPKKRAVLWCVGVGEHVNPYEPFVNLNQRFYKNRYLDQKVSELLPLRDSIDQSLLNLMVVNHSYIEKLHINQNKDWQIVKDGVPDWLLELKETAIHSNDSDVMVLYRYNSPATKL